MMTMVMKEGQDEKKKNSVINDNIFAQEQHTKVILRTESRTAQEYTREFGGHGHAAVLSILLSSSASITCPSSCLNPAPQLPQRKENAGHIQLWGGEEEEEEG